MYLGIYDDKMDVGTTGADPIPKFFLYELVQIFSLLSEDLILFLGLIVKCLYGNLSVYHVE